MKLTKSQLNQIIQEELEDFIANEGVWDKFKGAVGLGKKAEPEPEDIDPNHPGLSGKALARARRKKALQVDYAKGAEKRKNREQTKRMRAQQQARHKADWADRRKANWKTQEDEEWDAGRKHRTRKQTSDFHRANPGQAGSANLGYGEGIERAEIEKIIREELEDHMVDEGAWDKFKGAVGLGKKAAPPPEPEPEPEEEEEEWTVYDDFRVRRQEEERQKRRWARDAEEREERKWAASERRREKEAEADRKWRREQERGMQFTGGQMSMRSPYQESQKITRSQLIQIIQEELEGVLK